MFVSTSKRRAMTLSERLQEVRSGQRAEGAEAFPFAEQSRSPRPGVAPIRLRPGDVAEEQEAQPTHPRTIAPQEVPLRMAAAPAARVRVTSSRERRQGRGRGAGGAESRLMSRLRRVSLAGLSNIIDPGPGRRAHRRGFASSERRAKHDGACSSGSLFWVESPLAAAGEDFVTATRRREGRRSGSSPLALAVGEDFVTASTFVRVVSRRWRWLRERHRPLPGVGAGGGVALLRGERAAEVLDRGGVFRPKAPEVLSQAVLRWRRVRRLTNRCRQSRRQVSRGRRLHRATSTGPRHGVPPP